MKSPILLLALSVAAFSSCTTAYKSGQTPDDVYYSAAKPQDEYVQTEKEEDRQYKYDDQYYNDRFLRMKVHNRTRWSELNDWYYYDKYSYLSNYYFGSYNNPYNSWNYYYNPYCCCHNSVAVINSKIPAAPPVIKRNFSIAGYTQTTYNNSNKTTSTNKTPVRNNTKPAYNNSNSLSEKIKTIFSNENSGNGSNRTYTPSSSGTSGGNNNSGGNSGSGSGKSGSSGSGGSAPVSRPVRN